MEVDKDARTWATICHLSALIRLVGVPLGNILGPLVVWLAKRRENEFVDDQGKEALNFQITFTFCEIVLFILIFILAFGAPLHYQPFSILPVIFLPAMLIMMALSILNIGLVIKAAIRSNEGISYRYPFTLRMLSRWTRPKRSSSNKPTGQLDPPSNLCNFYKLFFLNY